MNNKELVNAGHELAKAISNDTPLIEIAKMVSNLATQLDVQTARANVLADDNAKAMLALKQADEAVKLGHSKFVGLVAENEVLKESVKHAAVCIAAAEAEGLIDALAEKDGERLADLIHRRLCHAYLPVETPATDAFLAEVRAQGVEMFAAYCGEENSVFVEAKAYYRSLPDAAYEFAAQLGKGVQP
ncbi:hypothetical protein [Enterobacter kobei]|uniref:hypothetical protein n=1 Tax=Enterobacter kobei TaxID=208224 RepID=UPI0018F70DB8|nr:hypothetical protein [Enterobacter kobei]MDD9222276.1 hypothetical protein [Enterobacter kobei]